MSVDEVTVIIPAFNEQEMIGRVVEEIVRRYRVVVVDDGSTDGTGEVARRSGATVLRHIVNRGQGAALQTGIDHALRTGAQYLVTFDADGQHSTDDIPQLLEPLRAGRAAVTLGSRFRGTTNAPVLRRVVLRVAVTFTRAVSRANVTDTHNGLRGFTREAATRLDLRMDRMAHASELIDQVFASGVPVEEVPVHIRYTPYSRRKGQSLFNAVRILLDYVVGRWSR